MGITWNVELKNIGAVNSPVCIAQMAKDSVISMQWVDGFAGTGNNYNTKRRCR